VQYKIAQGFFFFRVRKKSIQQAGAALRGIISAKLLDRDGAHQGPGPCPDAVLLSEAQRMAHIVATIEAAVLAHTTIIGTCSRTVGACAIMAISFKDLFALEPSTNFCHLRGGAQMQLKDFPGIERGAKVNVRILGYDPTPADGWPGPRDEARKLHMRVSFVSTRD
jgi:hypothetical protein